MFFLIALLLSLAQAETRIHPFLEFQDHCTMDSQDLEAVELYARLAQADPSPLAREDKRKLKALTKSGHIEASRLNLLTWVPNARPVQTNAAPCSADALEDGLRTRDRFQAREFMTRFFKRCESHLTRHQPSLWWPLLRLERAEYNLCRNSRIRNVRLHLGNGHKLTAWLALKDDAKPRPLIIAKCGVFCNPGSSSQRFLLMHLFDESPFHVLMIGNGTGRQFAQDNGKISFGGADEGYDLLSVAAALNAADSGLRRFISSLHVVGVSLGSHAALYSSLYQALSGQQLISSVTTLCPVVNLEETFHSHFNADTLRTRALAYVAWRQLSASSRYAPALRELMPQNFLSLSPARLPAIFARAAMDDYAQRAVHHLPPPFINWRLNDEQSFWASNRMGDHIRHVQTPVFAWASDDDPIVPSGVNSAALAASRFANEALSPVQVQIVNRGNHCAFGTTYGWDITSSVLRARILAEAPEFNANPQYRPLESRGFQGIGLKAEESILSASWHAQSHRRTFKVVLEIFNKRAQLRSGQSCRNVSPYALEAQGCVRRARVSVSFGKLNLQLPPPLNDTEAEALTRWANTNLRLRGPNKAEMPELHALPTELVVKTPY